MAHSNQRNFLEHSEEPYNKYRYLRLIPNLQLTSAGRTGTANGPQIALGPHFAQVCSRVIVVECGLVLGRGCLGLGKGGDEQGVRV